MHTNKASDILKIIGFVDIYLINKTLLSMYIIGNLQRTELKIAIMIQFVFSVARLIFNQTLTAKVNPHHRLKE